MHVSGSLSVSILRWKEKGEAYTLFETLRSLSTTTGRRRPETAMSATYRCSTLTELILDIGFEVHSAVAIV
jgi:hypothetical protein